VWMVHDSTMHPKHFEASPNMIQLFYPEKSSSDFTRAQHIGRCPR
jgi:hypothetical protein